MPLLLNMIASAVMLALLGCIAVRAWRELIQGVTQSGTLHCALARRGSDLLIFTLSLAVVWLGILVGHILARGGVDGFWANYLARATEGGDAPRYIFMAENGYMREGEYVNNIVFYPLYPLLVRLLSALLGGQTALAGMLISQACYGAACVVFYRLAKRLCPCPMAALAAFWLYPFGYFALGVYTEGLFLLLSIGCLYCLVREKWLKAGALGFFCALTRSQGILLLLPGVYLAWRAARQKVWDKRMLAVAAPLLGFVLYLSVNKAVCGQWFAFRFYESQSPWWQTAQWVGKTVGQQWAMAHEYESIARWIYWPQLALYFLGAALLYLGWRGQQETALTLYGTGYLGMSYTASWLISGGRYMLGCAPMFLAVGGIQRRALRWALLAAEMVFFVLFNVYFMQGQCIM